MRPRWSWTRRRRISPQYPGRPRSSRDPAHPSTDPDEAVARLGGAARRGRGTGLLAQYVLAAALRDPGWLDRCDLAAVPAVVTARVGALPDDVLAHLSTPDSGAPDRTGATRARSAVRNSSSASPLTTPISIRCGPR